MNEAEDQPHIVCLNYCRTDPESGYCLTCGRPPLPVTGINLAAPLFGGMKLSGLTRSAGKADVPEEK